MERQIRNYLTCVSKPDDLIFSSWYKHSIFCNRPCLCFSTVVQKCLIESHSGTLLRGVFKFSSLDSAMTTEVLIKKNPHLIVTFDSRCQTNDSTSCFISHRMSDTHRVEIMSVNMNSVIGPQSISILNWSLCIRI